RVFVVLGADRVDAKGMVIDFDTVEQRARGYLDEALDHRLLLQQGDPACAALAGIGEPIVTLEVPPTAENLAKLVYEQLVRARRARPDRSGVPLRRDSPGDCSSKRRKPGNRTSRRGRCRSRVLRASGIGQRTDRPQDHPAERADGARPGFLDAQGKGRGAET